MLPDPSTAIVLARSCLTQLANGRNTPADATFHYVAALRELMRLPQASPVARTVLVVPGGTREQLLSTCLDAVSSLVAFDVPWPTLLSILDRLTEAWSREHVAHGPECSGRESASDDVELLDYGHALLLQVIRTNLLGLAANAPAGFPHAYWTVLEQIDSLHDSVNLPAAERIADVPRAVMHAAARAGMKQLSLYGLDPVVLIEARTALDASWLADHGNTGALPNGSAR